jgi:hypothetical protein
MLSKNDDSITTATTSATATNIDEKEVDRGERGGNYVVNKLLDISEGGGSRKSQLINEVKVTAPTPVARRTRSNLAKRDSDRFGWTGSPSNGLNTTSSSGNVSTQPRRSSRLTKSKIPKPKDTKSGRWK